MKIKDVTMGNQQETNALNTLILVVSSEITRNKIKYSQYVCVDVH